MRAPLILIIRCRNAERLHDPELFFFSTGTDWPCDRRNISGFGIQQQIKWKKKKNGSWRQQLGMGSVRLVKFSIARLVVNRKNQAFLNGNMLDHRSWLEFSVCDCARWISAKKKKINNKRMRMVAHKFLLMRRLGVCSLASLVSRQCEKCARILLRRVRSEIFAIDLCINRGWQCFCVRATHVKYFIAHPMICLYL